MASTRARAGRWLLHTLLVFVLVTGPVNAEAPPPDDLDAEAVAALLTILTQVETVDDLERRVTDIESRVG